MAYYYVKSGGTLVSTPASTTKKTGSFASIGASQYYDEIADVNDYNVLADGDVICVSNAHNKTGADASTFSDQVLGTIYVVSVSDANCDQYSAGATESSATSITVGSIATYSTYIYKGITLQVRDLVTTASGHLILEECTVNVNQTGFGAADYAFQLDADGRITLIDTDVLASDIVGVTKVISINNGSHFEWRGGTLLSTTNLVDFFALDTIKGSNAVIVLDNVDFSSHNGMTIAETTTGATTATTSKYKINNCKLPASWSYTNNGWGTGSIDVINSDNSVAYFIAKDDFYGNSYTQATYARSGGASIGGTGIAFVVTTSAKARDGRYGHRFLLGELYGNFATVQTISVYMQYSSGGAVDLQTDEIWIEVYVPDGTMQRTRYTSGTLEFGSAASDYANNTETWSGSLADAVKQTMAVTTAGSEGAGIASVYLVVAKPSLTVYVDPQPDIA